jgi:hypothetical protein
MKKFFLTQIKHTAEGFIKGVVVKDTLDEARQSFHAYLGAYGYGHEAGTDYVVCYICDIDGRITDMVVDNRMIDEGVIPNGN